MAKKHLGKICSQIYLCLFLLIFVLNSCSSTKTDEIDFSRVLIRVNSDGNPGFLAKLDPKSLTFDCTLRNDSPYYWCGIDGDFKSPDPSLPKRLSTVFHTVVNKRSLEKSKKLVDTLRESSQPVTAVLSIANSLDQSDNTISSQLVGIYNDKICMNLFDDYSLCPKSAKIYDIYK